MGVNYETFSILLVLTSSHRQPLDIDLLLEQIGECKTTRTTQQVLIVDYSILIVIKDMNIVHRGVR